MLRRSFAGKRILEEEDGCSLIPSSGMTLRMVHGPSEIVLADLLAISLILWGSVMLRV